MESNPEILGIDIGSTIVDRNIRPKGPFPDALRVITRLVKERFGVERTFIVSKVNMEQKHRAERWLEESNFYKITGVRREHVEFCPERCDKAPICQRLGITHFIDDRPEVHHHLFGIVSNRYLFQGVERDIERYRERNADVIRVHTWLELERLLLG